MYDREYLFFPFRCQLAVPGLQRFRFRERTCRIRSTMQPLRPA